MARATRAALLLDRAYHREAPAGPDGLARDGRDGGSEWTLGADGAAAKQAITIAAHRDEAGHGIDVAEQQHFLGTTPPEGHDVADLVPPGGKTHAAHPRDQPLAERALLGGWARDGEHLLEQLDAAEGLRFNFGASRRDHAGTPSSAATRRT